MSWKFIEKIASTNMVSLMKSVLAEKEVQEFITNLNTEVQLFQNNENSLGIKLYTVGGEYTQRTMSLNSEKKSRKEITLHDTGEFYDSFIVAILGNGDFQIFADPMKTDDQGNTSNLTERWGKEITGLTTENHKKVIKFLEKKTIERLCK